MADGVAITAGSGTTILTDDTGAGGHAQVVKLAISTDGSGALIPADAANGIDVDVTRVSGSVTVAQATASNLNANVSGTVAATQSGAWSVGINAGSNAIGSITNTSFAVTQATAANLNATVVGSGNFTVVGDVADDSIDSGNPIKIGAFAEANPSTSVLVADGDRTNVHADIDGLLVTKPYTSFGDILVERVTDTGGTSTASTVFGATASARNMITTIAVYNDSTTNGFIDFRDGTAGTVLFTLPLPAKGGAVTNFPLPLRQTTANTAFAYDVSAALTTVYISLIGFKSKV